MTATTAAGSLIQSPLLRYLIMSATLCLVYSLFHTLIKAARLSCLSVGKVDETAAVKIHVYVCSAVGEKYSAKYIKMERESSLSASLG